MDKSNLERLLINLHYVLKEIYGPSAGRWLKYASYHLLPFLDQGHPLVQGQLTLNDENVEACQMSN